MKLKITVELPTKLEEALDLFCGVCHKLLEDDKTAYPIVEAPSEDDKDVPPGKAAVAETQKFKKAEPPQPPKVSGKNEMTDKKFEKLELPTMEAILSFPENLTGFRFRVFAAKARQEYGRKVELLATELNDKGINGILKGKHKDQAAEFIRRVTKLEFPEVKEETDNNVEF